MTSTQWRPVGETTVKCACDETRCNAELHTNDDWLEIESDELLSTITLPDDYRLFKRVDAADDAITPDALEAAGWIRIPEDDWEIEHWIAHIDPSTTLKAIVRGEEQGVFLHHGDRDFDYIHMSGCTTMSQLAQLVAMLGGEA